MLRFEDFKKIRAREMFAHGLQSDSPRGINLTGSGETLLWVAVKGDVDDFAIYVMPVELANWSIARVRDFGDKIHDRNTIQRLLNCDDEVLAKYRD